MTDYIIRNVKVLAIEERSRIVRAYKDGDEVKTESENLGWFVRLDGSYESLCLGNEKPDLSVGQMLTIRLET